MDRTRLATPERRRYERSPIHSHATAAWVALSGQQCVARAEVLDASIDGLALQIHEPLPLGRMVRVRVGETEFLVLVRHCQTMASGFQCGVQTIRTPGWAGKS